MADATDGRLGSASLFKIVKMLTSQLETAAGRYASLRRCVEHFILQVWQQQECNLTLSSLLLPSFPPLPHPRGPSRQFFSLFFPAATKQTFGVQVPLGASETSFEWFREGQLQVWGDLLSAEPLELGACRTLACFWHTIPQDSLTLYDGHI